MDRLQLILDEIARDSALQEERILSEAKDRAALFLEKEKAESEKEKALILSEAEKKAAQNRAVAASSAAALKKRRLLQEKSRLIGLEIDAYRQKILSLPDEAYYAYFCRYLEKMEPGGEILLAAADRARDRKCFEKQMEETERKTGKTWVYTGKTTEDAASGLIVRYGKIEENLSLEAIFSEREDEVKDRLFAVLFREQV